MYMRSLRGYEKVWGSEHPSTLTIVDNLGSLYIKQGKYAEAEKMCIRALREHERTWGPEHPSILETIKSLGFIYANQGKYAEAEKLYIRAVQWYERVIGSQDIGTHRRAINNMWGMGILATDQGQLLEARTYYQRAYHDLRSLLGPSHNDVIMLQNNILNIETRITGQALVAADVVVPTAMEITKM